MHKSFFFILIFIQNILFAQTPEISGYIKNTEGTPLQGVYIIINGTRKNTTSNKDGFYKVKIKNNKIVLSVYFLGYKDKFISVNTVNDTTINIILEKSKNQIEEVEIIGERDFEKAERETTISSEIINTLPSIAGEKDIIKALLFVPGVQTGNEATTGLFVRGGNSDQNLILLENMPIYNVSHLFGYMSVFDVDMTNNISIIKAGFPASYGGRLSSIIKIDLKNGNTEKIKGNYSLGIVSSKLQLEIPLKKSTYLLVSGRKTYFDLLSRFFNSVKDDSGKKSGTYLSFYDLNIRFTSKLSKKNRLYLNFYTGDDKIEFSDKSKIETLKTFDIYKSKTGNIVSSLTFKHLFNSKQSLNFLTGFTQYRNLESYETSIKNKAYPEENESDFYKQESYIFDYKNMLKYKYSNQFIITENGVEFINHHYVPFSVSYNKNMQLISETFRPYEFAVFTNNKFFIKNLTVNTGLRYTQYKITDTCYHYPEPRISLKYSFKKNITAKASYTIMHQYNHLLSNISTGMPTDIWYPVTKNTIPMKSEQFSVGVTKKKIFKIAKTGVELYYKKMTNLIDFSDNVISDLNITNINYFIVKGGLGISYGFELFSRINTKKINGAISYTLSKTDRQFSKINSGNPYPFKYDRRHNFTSFISYNFSERASISASWTYMTGYALTLPAGRYYSPNTINNNQAVLILYTERNQFRMPAYHRLDLAVKFKKKKEKGIRTWEINIYNVYNRQNAYFIEIYPDVIYNEQTHKFEHTKPKIWQRSLLPIIPSISYHFTF